MNYFGKMVDEILQNNYFKNKFEMSEIRDFVPPKMACFLNFKCSTYLENR